VPPPAQVLRVAQRHAAEQAALAEQAVGVTLSITNRARNPEAWRDAVARIGPNLLTLQVAAAGAADGYLDEILDAQGESLAAEATVIPDAWMDFTDGGGSWLLNLVHAVNAIPKQGLSSEALNSRVRYLSSSIVLSGMQDTDRSAVQAAMISRPAVQWYVRMLTGKTCARCAILAGKRSRSMVAFKRHRNCDCRNIPAGENSGNWATNPKTFFRSLSTQEQDKVFGAGNARAIRHSGGSSKTMNQVVNAEQGVKTVTMFGREIQVTTVGTTRRATFGGYEVLEDGTLRRRPDSELEKLRGNRLSTAKAPRLLPDEIYRLAEEFGWDRAETLRQLRRFAYLL
jgi:hypothetical protein